MVSDMNMQLNEHIHKRLDKNVKEGLEGNDKNAREKYLVSSG